MNAGRLIELRGDLLMGLALGAGRMSELFDRLSHGLHERAMQDLARTIIDELSDSDECSQINDPAVPELSQLRENGTAGTHLVEKGTPTQETGNQPIEDGGARARSDTGESETPSHGQKDGLAADARFPAGVHVHCPRFDEHEHWPDFHGDGASSVKIESRPDRGWQRAGDVMRRVVEDLQAGRRD